MLIWFNAGEILLLDAEGSTEQKKKFSIKDFFSKCGGFGHIYWRNP